MTIKRVCFHRGQQHLGSLATITAIFAFGYTDFTPTSGHAAMTLNLESTRYD